MIEKKIEVGMKLYEKKYRMRRSAEYEIAERTVTKVGNKYLYVDDKSEGFDKNTLAYTSPQSSMFNTQLYRSKEDIETEQKLIASRAALKEWFRYDVPKHLTSDQITRILNIINEPTK